MSLTTYSADVAGDARNYHWHVSFDVTDGYVGITQFAAGKETERVLLTPSQIRALVAFLRCAPDREPR